MTTLEQLLDRLWDDYARLNPQAQAIHRLLQERGETVVNDHIALRTFDDPRVGIDALARAFIDRGYSPKGQYTFPKKKLNARHYEPPASPPGTHLPKVFISELKVDQFPARFGQLVQRLIDQIPPDLPSRPDFPAAGRPWQVSYADYETLRAQSEYGAWLAAFGFCANHFTIDVGALSTFDSLQQFNTFIEEHGFALNDIGGKIKGSPQVYLEQSSTLAAEAPVEFTDGMHPIPCCYYEFAKRYRTPDGTLFQGFIAQSADKIFQSTDRG